MKTLLLLTVLVCAALSVRAAAVEAENKVETAPSPVEAENKVEMAFSPDDMTVDGGEMAAQLEGRSFLCPAGWVRYSDGCYLYMTSGRSWTSAEAYCSRLGASLPSVHNIWDYNFLQQLASRSGQTTAWLGGHYFLGWRWLDQSQFDYSNWSTVNTVSRFQCIHLNSRVGWSNNNCASALPFICVRRSDTC